MKIGDTITLGSRIWLEYNGNTFLAPGKAELLDNLDNLGSLRKAAEQMKMSYRKAWYSVKQMNINAKEPLVKLERGGARGGRTTLTPYGKKVLDIYKNIASDCDTYLSGKLKNLHI